jgi:hypothetical protein
MRACVRGGGETFDHSVDPRLRRIAESALVSHELTKARAVCHEPEYARDLWRTRSQGVRMKVDLSAAAAKAHLGIIGAAVFGMPSGRPYSARFVGGVR